MLVLGLTGSISTGKTTISKWLQEINIPVFEADAYVHKLFTTDDEVINSIKELWPHCVNKQGVDRTCLRSQILDDRHAIQKIEAITHPKVKIAEEKFIKQSKEAGKSICVLDVPLLYEASHSKLCDCVLVVYCSPEAQKQRAAARGVSPSLLDYLTSLQLPLADKIYKADFKLNTDGTLEETRQLLLQKLNEIELRYNISI